MILEEYFNYRNELLDQSKDDEGFIQENLILSQVLPSMLDAKLIDSEDFTNSYFKSAADKLKINAYSINESGERLQLFLIDENSIVYGVKEIIALNKVELLDEKEVEEIKEKFSTLDRRIFTISAATGYHLDQLTNLCLEYLQDE